MARSQPKDFTEITTASILMAQLINCLLPHCTLADRCFLFKNATQSLNFYLISLFSEISDATQGVSPILYNIHQDYYIAKGTTDSPINEQVWTLDLQGLGGKGRGGVDVP